MVTVQSYYLVTFVDQGYKCMPIQCAMVVGRMYDTVVLCEPPLERGEQCQLGCSGGAAVQLVVVEAYSQLAAGLDNCGE